MTLIKTGLLNALAVGVRVITSILLNKILAIYVGPGGFATIGQFQNFVTLVTTFANGAINSGVTKYTAEYHDNERDQIAIWKTAGTITLAGTLLTSFVVIILNEYLALWILNNKAYGNVFIWLGVGLLPFTLNGLLLSILNGKKEIRSYVLINISGSLIGLFITGGLAMSLDLFGALVSLAISQSIVFFVTLVFYINTAWFKVSYIVGKIEILKFQALGKFGLMALTSAICVSISQMTVRDYLVVNFGVEAAGHWEALMRISGLYLMLVTVPLSIYYLPRISEIRNLEDLRREIIMGYRFLLPISITGAFAIYVCRDWIILWLFTAEFLPMRDLFAIQMIGDIAKIGSWLLAYVLLGKAVFKTYIFLEITFSFTWVGFVWLATESFGVSGAQMAYMINYLLYWLSTGTIIYFFFYKNDSFNR